MNHPIRLTHTLAAVYQQLFATCTVKPQHRAAVEHLAAQLRKQQQRYAEVEQASQVPWAVIAVIHAMESSQRFDRHLHNGDPLHSRTVNVPAQRPLGQPPFTWEASAIDAQHYSGLSAWRDWSIAGTLFKLEAYNGSGLSPLPSAGVVTLFVVVFLSIINVANTPPMVDLMPI